MKFKHIEPKKLKIFLALNICMYYIYIIYTYIACALRPPYACAQAARWLHVQVPGTKSLATTLYQPSALRARRLSMLATLPLHMAQT